MSLADVVRSNWGKLVLTGVLIVGCSGKPEPPKNDTKLDELKELIAKLEPEKPKEESKISDAETERLVSILIKPFRDAAMYRDNINEHALEEYNHPRINYIRNPPTINYPEEGKPHFYLIEKTENFSGDRIRTLWKFEVTYGPYNIVNSKRTFVKRRNLDQEKRDEKYKRALDKATPDLFIAKEYYKRGSMEGAGKHYGRAIDKFNKEMAKE